MNPYIEILRPGNAIMGAITIVLIALIDKTFSLPIIIAMAAVFFETAAGNVINDYFDYNIDLINKPERPIPSGRISLKNGKKLRIFSVFSRDHLRFFNQLFDKQLDSFRHCHSCRCHSLLICI